MNTLRVRKLPPELSKNEIIDLLQHFGAVNVKCIGTKNVTVFARFESAEAAEVALKRLHQLDVLGYLLNVDFARPRDVTEINEFQDESKCMQKTETTEKTGEGSKKYEMFLRKLNAWSLGLDLIQPPPTHLRYQYPPPTMPVIANIARALCAVPRFYTQVLHLMNRMNLPSPFHETRGEHKTALDSLLLAQKPCQIQSEVQHENIEERFEPSMETTSTESELESDTDCKVTREEIVPKLPAKRSRRMAKRPRLTVVKPTVSKIVPIVPVHQVFEIPGTAGQPQQRKIELRVSSRDIISSEDTSNATISAVSSEGGFGVLFPPVPEPTSENSEETKIEESSNSDSATISVTQLRANRIPEKDRSLLQVYKGYQTGTPSCRLYVKNVAKTVTARDLHFIFREFLEPEGGNEMFDIRYMTEGRMRGQAFITYPSIKNAQMALRETNGYILQNKPLVVQYARSAKAAQTE